MNENRVHVQFIHDTVNWINRKICIALCEMKKRIELNCHDSTVARAGHLRYFFVF